jgi:c-di-GMP-binding flagellar brake protein YcgR
MTQDFHEKRLSARIKGNFHMTIQEDREEITVNAIDLSSSGLRFKSLKNIPLFREISINLQLPFQSSKKEEFRCNAIVVRNERSHYQEGYNIALTFVDVEDDDRKILHAFLEQASGNLPQNA